MAVLRVLDETLDAACFALFAEHPSLVLEDVKAHAARHVCDGERSQECAGWRRRAERAGELGWFAATDVDALFEYTLATLSLELGLEHGFLLLADGAGERLYNVASHGFDHARFGAEIAVGEGLYGTAAARQVAVRIGSMRRERLLWRALARESALAAPTYLPLPGLENVESTIAVPVLYRERCFGVLCFQSAKPGAFTSAYEKMLLIVARQLAAMVALLVVGSHDVEVPAKRGPMGGRALLTRVKFFESDGSIFLDDEYLIQGVAGRILWRVLMNYATDDATNSRARRSGSLRKSDSAIKDNLEARLIALRKRLHERTSALRIEKVGRGRFRLEVSRELVLERRP